MRYTHRSNLDSPIGYRLIGNGSAHVMLIHGLGTDSADWTAPAIQGQLRGFDATYAAVDLPGHSPSDEAVAQHDLSELARDLVAVAGTLGWSTFGVAGYSFGALVAAQLTLVEPRVSWCAAGGLTKDIWDDDARAEYGRRLADDSDLADPTVAGTRAFLQERGRDMGLMAALLQLQRGSVQGRPTSTQRILLLSANEDQAGARLLASATGLEIASTPLPGDHVTAFTHGHFVEPAMNFGQVARLHSPTLDEGEQPTLLIR